MTTWIDNQDQSKIDAAISMLTRDQLSHGEGDPRFALWLALVDRYISKASGDSGFGHRDMVDWTWRDAYDAGYAPVDAAREAMDQDEIFSQFMEEE